MAGSRLQEESLQRSQCSIPQKIGQACLRFTEAVTLPFLVYEVVPALILPYKGMLETSIVPAGHIIYSVTNYLIYTDEPLTYARAVGGGNAAIGLLKMGVSSGTALASMLATGYEASDLGLRYLPVLIQSDNPVAQLVAKILIIDSYRWAAMGVFSYAAYRSINAVCMKFWNCVIEPQEEFESVQNKLNLAQQAGEYVVRWAGALTMTEAALYYLGDFGYRKLAANSRLQLGIMLASDLVRQVGKYFFYTPRSFSALIPEVRDDERDLESGIVPERPKASTKAQVGCLMVNQSSLLAAAWLTTFLMNEFIGSLFSECKPDEECQFKQRMERLSMLFAFALVISYASQKVATKISSVCSSSFFSRPSDEQHSLLDNEETSANLRNGHV
jgi:hypothetical protein